MTKEPIKLPKPADTTIEMVCGAFLADQRKRLKDASYARYDAIIDLFMDMMNGYGHQTLDTREKALFEQYYNEEGKGQRDYCQIFGPDKIPENVGEFLGYFMVRKVMCGPELKKASGTVIKKLSAWLRDHEYISAEEAAEMLERGRDAVYDLPAADKVAEMFAPDMLGPPVDDDNCLEGQFDIVKVRPGILHIENSFGDQGIMVVSVPIEVTELCQEGWSFSGLVGKHGRSWRILEMWTVYP